MAESDGLRKRAQPSPNAGVEGTGAAELGATEAAQATKTLQGVLLLQRARTFIRTQIVENFLQKLLFESILLELLGRLAGAVDLVYVSVRIFMDWAGQKVLRHEKQHGKFYTSGWGDLRSLRKMQDRQLESYKAHFRTRAKTGVVDWSDSGMDSEKQKNCYWQDSYGRLMNDEKEGIRWRIDILADGQAEKLSPAEKQLLTKSQDDPLQKAAKKVLAFFFFLYNFTVGSFLDTMDSGKKGKNDNEDENGGKGAASAQAHIAEVLTVHEADFLSSMHEYLPRESRRGTFYLCVPSALKDSFPIARIIGDNSQEVVVVDEKQEGRNDSENRLDASRHPKFVYLMPATGETGMAARLELAAALAAAPHYYCSIIPCGCYYGPRKPPGQVLHFNETLASQLVQNHAMPEEAAGICLHLERMYKKHYGERQVVPRFCFTGFSFGAAMASTAAMAFAVISENPRAVAVASYVGASSPATYAEGVLVHDLDLETLLFDEDNFDSLEETLEWEIDHGTTNAARCKDAKQALRHIRLHLPSLKAGYAEKWVKYDLMEKVRHLVIAVLMTTTMENGIDINPFVAYDGVKTKRSYSLVREDSATEQTLPATEVADEQIIGALVAHRFLHDGFILEANALGLWANMRKIARRARLEAFRGGHASAFFRKFSLQQQAVKDALGMLEEEN